MTTIRKDWQTRPLAKCGVWVSGGTPSKSVASYWNGNIPWISSKSLKSFDLSDSEDRLTDEAVRNGTGLVPVGTVIFVVRGMSLANEFRVGVTNRPVTFNQDLRAIIPAKDIDGRYLARFLKASEPVILGLVNNASHGTKRLPTELLELVNVPVPLLPEQQRIVAILDKSDAIRQKREEALASLAQFESSLFYSFFAELFDDDKESGLVPVKSFVERFESGLSLATPDTPSLETRYYILKVSSVTWRDYRPEECKPLPRDYEPPEDHFVRKGDLLFSRANTTELVGATVYVDETPTNRVLPDKIWRFVWRNPNEVEPLFVHALMNHPAVRFEIGRRATGTSGSMKNISMEKVLSMRVPSPPIGLQRRFARAIMEARAIISRMGTQRNDCKILFDSLSQRAFRGEL
ncbi:MAG: restriction endonuclease subunit S [Isosphaeraceae bacterium]